MTKIQPKVFNIVVDSLLSRVPEPEAAKGENDYVLVFKDGNGKVLYFRHTKKGICPKCAEAGITTPVKLSIETLSEKRAMRPSLVKGMTHTYELGMMLLCPFHAMLREYPKKEALEKARAAGQDINTLSFLALLED